MLPTTISTTDPKSGAELPVPVEFRIRVGQAAEILSEEVATLTDKFELSAVWRFVRRPSGTIAVQLVVSSAESDDRHLNGGPYNSQDFADVDSTRRALRPALMELGHMLSALVQVRLDSIRKQLYRDLELLYATAED